MNLKKRLWFATIASLFLLAGFMSSCKDENVEVIGECPIVVSTIPANLAINVPLGQVITATFNVAMDPETINQASFTVESVTMKSAEADKGAAVNTISGSVSYSGMTATFTPSGPLTAGTTYKATIEESARDLIGTALQTNHVWTFSTGALIIPVVTSASPLNLATGVVVDAVVSANFSMNMDPLTITTSTFTLMDGETPVTGVVNYSGTTATFTPSAALSLDKTYTATITAEAANLEGTTLAEDFVWSFATAGLAPTVTATLPLDLAANVALNQAVTATFSVPMDASTITTTTFTLMDGETPVEGVVTYTGTTATFTPSSLLSLEKTYTATITTGAVNLAGTPLAEDYVWTFSTIGAAPTVTATLPLDLATNVALDQAVTASFSGEMDPLTITTETFTLMDGAIGISGSVTYSGNTATFTPDNILQPGTTYTATITTGAENLAGTALASNHVWSFTTAEEALAPTVTSTIPLNMATNVAVNQMVSASFSVQMDPLSITALTFTLMDGLNPVAGNINYSGTTATFTPGSDLDFGTTYTATITTGAENLAGTALANDHVWSFTTEAAPPKGPGIVNLGSAGDFAILTKSGISTVGTTLITGHIGVSPIGQTAITGFSETMHSSGTYSTSSYVVGNIYAADYMDPTPAYVSTAISDQETAFTTAMGLTTDVIVDLGAGDISGMTLAPGLYKWGTGLLITNQGVTLSGGPDDTWVFQISSDFTIDNDAKIILAGGAQAKNIFWVTSTQALLGTNVEFSGNIIAQTLISLTNGTSVLGRLLSQSAVTLDASTVTKP